LIFDMSEFLPLSWFGAFARWFAGPADALPPLAVGPVVPRIALANLVSELAFAAALPGTGRFVGEAIENFGLRGHS
jgi:hypothetical protein